MAHAPDKATNDVGVGKNVITTDTSNISSAAIIDRDYLFPPSVAKKHGLDPETYCTIEVPHSERGVLYPALLLYAGQYAVDLGEEIPENVEEDDNTAEQVAKKVTSCANSDKEKPSRDATDPLSSVTNELRRYVEPGPNKTLVAKRVGGGRLSTLWNNPEDDLESFDSDSSSDSQPDSDSDSIHGLRQRRPPRILRWEFGLGYGKLSFHEGDEAEAETSQRQENDQNDTGPQSHTILLRHVAVVPPLATDDHVSVYRTLVLAGPDSRTIQRFCALVSRWKGDRTDAGHRSRPGTFTLFRYKLYGSSGAWERQRRKRGRPQHSVILKDRMLEIIVNDLKDFCAKDTKAWYEDHGIPHRRSLLFYGPPGTGKTSTIKMLSGMFRLNACFLSFTSPDFSNQSLHDALSSLPGKALLVLEDVDVLFNEDRKAETSSSVTFSGLLNAIDGLISVDGIITIFTTNHIERLDRALIRGGRVDRRFEFVHPNAAHIANVFRSFYPTATDKQARQFANAILDRKEEEARTIATMQQHFIYTRRMSAQECIDKVPEFFEEFYAEGGKPRNLIYT